MRRKFNYIRAFAVGLLCTLTCFLILITDHSSRGSTIFKPPRDARVINVLDFGATPNDSTDDTAAIQKAIVKALDNQNRYAFPPFIFIPKGTYLLSDTLSSRVRQGGWSDGWLAGMILMGESRSQTILKLKNNLPAFANPSKPKPVIMTGSESDGNSNPSGSGNKAFRPNQDAPANIPAVIIRNSKVSLAYRITGSNGPDVFEYPLQIREEQAGTKKELTLAKLSSMGVGQTVPLFNSTR